MAENKNITESTKYFFKNIIYLNLKGNSEEYKTGVLQRLWTIQWWPLGQKLIEAIVKEAKGTIYNTQLLIYNHHGASDYKEYYRGLPDNGKLYFDLGYYERQPYFDPTQKSVIECGKTYVYLFHELLHFYHNLKHIFNADLQEEYRTVGLYEYMNEPFFSENAFRKAIQLPRRPCYTWNRSSVKYDAEKKKRALLKLQEQSVLTSSSDECKHDWVTKVTKKGVH